MTKELADALADARELVANTPIGELGGNISPMLSYRKKQERASDAIRAIEHAIAAALAASPPKVESDVREALALIVEHVEMIDDDHWALNSCEGFHPATAIDAATVALDAAPAPVESGVVERALTPCPFCGPAGRLEITMNDGSAPYKVVTCYGCDTEGPLGKTEDEAASKWNNRALLTLTTSGEVTEAMIEAGQKVVDGSWSGTSASQILIDVFKAMCAAQGEGKNI